MKWLLDTNILSATSKHNPPRKLLRWLEVNADDSALSVVSLAELSFGVNASPDEAKREKLSKWMADLKVNFADAVIGLDEETLVEWKQLSSELKRKNRTISREDSLIAATARRNSLTIVTMNTRDFVVTGVASINPLD